MLPRATRYGITWFLFPSFCLTAFSKFFILKTYSFIIMKNHVNKEIGKHKHMVYFMQYQHTTQQMQSPEAMPSRDIKWWTQPGLAHHITSCYNSPWDKHLISQNKVSLLLTKMNGCTLCPPHTKMAQWAHTGFPSPGVEMVSYVPASLWPGLTSI